MTRICFSICMCVAMLGCGDDSTTPGPGTGGGTDAGPSVGFDSGPAGGFDAGGPAATDAGTAPGTDSGTPPGPDAGDVVAMGACTNPADEAIFMSVDVEDRVGECAGDCFGARDCTTECVVRETGLSMPCAQCFGDVSQCTVDNCAFRCFGGGDSPDCMACRDEAGCTAAFEACSGLE